MAFAAELAYRRYLLERVLELGLTWHGHHDSGDTIDKVNKAADGLGSFAANVFQVIQVVVKLLGTAAALCWFSPWVGALALGLALATFVGILQFDRRLIPQYSRLNRLGNDASAKMFDALANVTTAKILHIEQPLVEGVMARYAAPWPVYRANVSLAEWKWFFGGMCFQAVALVPLALYIVAAVRRGDALDAGTVSALYMYLSNLTAVYAGFSSFYQEINIFKHRVLNAADLDHAQAQTPVRRPVHGWQQLALRHVVFSYGEAAGLPGLHGVDLCLRRGERVALVGESGAGKSTFLKVLHGMYSDAQGAVEVDDAPAASTCFADLDLRTMLVPQEPEVFSASIRENITLGIGYDEAELAEAIRLATFDKVLATLPRGLDSVVNEEGG